MIGCLLNYLMYGRMKLTISETGFIFMSVNKLEVCVCVYIYIYIYIHTLTVFQRNCKFTLRGIVLLRKSLIGINLCRPHIKK